MAYSNFTLNSITKAFSLTIRDQVDIFSAVTED
jgi:hypothetical protein